MKKYSCIVWDWNGTLLDDVSVNLRTANRMLVRRGLAVIPSADVYRELFCFPVINFYKKLNFDLEAEDFNSLAEEYVATYTAELASAKLFPGARETLELVSKSGIRQVIVSATEHTRLRGEVASHGVAELFSGIFGVGDNLGSSKVAVAQRFVEQSALSPDKIVFVGDTAHDAAVAKACGCDCVLIANGHQSRKVLEDACPTVIESISDVQELIL